MEAGVLLELRVAHQQAVIGIPQNKGFRVALDRGPQPVVGSLCALRQRPLLSVTSTAMPMRWMLSAFGSTDLRLGPHPDPLAIGVPHPEDLVDLIGFAGGPPGRRWCAGRRPRDA